MSNRFLDRARLIHIAQKSLQHNDNFKIAATELANRGWQSMTASMIPYALVVDDDAFILMQACDILEDAGFRFYEASNGDEAKALLGKLADHVTLLFSDVEMPGKTNGFALARHVAEHWPWIEIVIASGRSVPSPGDMPEKATFIGKPFDNQMVHDHLRRTLPDRKKPKPLKQVI